MHVTPLRDFQASRTAPPPAQFSGAIIASECTIKDKKIEPCFEVDSRHS